MKPSVLPYAVTMLAGALAGLAAVAGCTLATAPQSPAAIAEHTVLDERVGIGVTTAYTAASRLGAALARGGLIDKAAFKRADAAGYEAVLALRAAYQAGNADSYAAAARDAYAAVSRIQSLVK